jgi:SAM-dependent methyltransferase
MQFKTVLRKLFLKVVKRWSRSGLYEISSRALESHSDLQKVLSIGGFGPVNDYYEAFLKDSSVDFITLDIDSNHKPDILADICEEGNNFGLDQFDAILALEVFEHLLDPQIAVKNCFSMLKPGGILITSTPWIIPIHDRPNDFHRFTPMALRNLCSEFDSVIIYARGNYYDSIVMLLLRGFFSGKSIGKFFMCIGGILSFLSRTPRIHEDLDLIDSTIGYVVVSRKNE